MLCAQKQLPTPAAEAAAMEGRENKDIAFCQFAAAANPQHGVFSQVRSKALPPGSETLGKTTFCY